MDFTAVSKVLACENRWDHIIAYHDTLREANAAVEIDVPVRET